MIEWLIIIGVCFGLSLIVGIVVGTVIKWGNDYLGLEDVTLEDL